MAEKIGQGSYPSYHGLWHLRALRIVNDLREFESTVWKEVHENIGNGGPVRIALVDTSVDADHPNLEGAIDKTLAVDFVSNTFGRFSFDNGDKSKLPDKCECHKEDAAGLDNDFIKKIDEIMDCILRSLRTDDGNRPAVSNAFSSHATSMAGIMGGRPVSKKLHIPESLSPEQKEFPEQDIALPYAGVNPFCEVVPISTSADPRPVQTLHALVYADMINADIIVLATDLPRPRFEEMKQLDHVAKIPNYGHEAENVEIPINVSEDERHGVRQIWDLVERYIICLSRRRPIVCAAGNSSSSRVSFPASLHAEGNGIVSVGARTSKDMRASYSPGSKTEDVTVFAISGDGERRDDELFRLDPFRARANKHENEGLFTGKHPPEHAAVEAILAPDIGGRFGQTDSRFLSAYVPGTDKILYDPASFYCRFSGTSAATAIAAGVLSLMMATGRVGRPESSFDANDMKEKLVGGKAYDGKRGLPEVLWRP